MTDLGEIKHDRPCSRRWLLRHGALALPFILAGIPARAAERVGSVEDVTGEAFAEIDTVRRTLDRAAPVFLGDDVVTGISSRLGMRLGRDARIRLGEQARLKIDRFLVEPPGRPGRRCGPTSPGLAAGRESGPATEGCRHRSRIRDRRGADPHAAFSQTDFTEDLKKISVPVGHALLHCTHVCF
jgi:hypothetical protein